MLSINLIKKGHTMKQCNFKLYKDNQQKTNTRLIQKAIKYLKNSNASLSNNKISETTFLLAESTLGERGITPSAISKNKFYKSLITQARYENISQKSTISTKFGTDGDVRMELFKVKIQSEQLKQENIILKELLSKYGGDIPTHNLSKDKELNNMIPIKDVTKGLIQRLFELGIVEQNIDTGNLVVAQYGDVLLNHAAYTLIIGDK